MVDGHLQIPDEGVAALFKEDGGKLLVEVNKEELEVRATVPSATLTKRGYVNDDKGWWKEELLLEDLFVNTFKH